MDNSSLRVGPETLCSRKGYTGWLLQLGKIHGGGTCYLLAHLPHPRAGQKHGTCPQRHSSRSVKCLQPWLDLLLLLMWARHCQGAWAPRGVAGERRKVLVFSLSLPHGSSPPHKPSALVLTCPHRRHGSSVPVAGRSLG